MQYTIYQADAFAEKLFAGNPAAIVPMKEWPEEKLMQQIAMENNLAETAYFVPSAIDGSDFHLRWFTPASEIDLCGHATLASAFILRTELGWKKDIIRFSTEKASILEVRIADDNNYELAFPPYALQQTAIPENLAEMLGLPKDAIEEVWLGRDLMAVVNHEEQILAAKPDITKIVDLPGAGLLITAAGTVYDSVSRCFFPKMQINEDPVTGSAHCHIVPYWSKRLGKEKLACLQASERSGILRCRFENDKVYMAGSAVLYLKGTIWV